MALLFDLRDLEFIVAAAEEHNFTRAAARVCVSQPAFSQRVAALESRIGARLFERTKHGVALTPRGQALIDGARGLLATAAMLVGPDPPSGRDAQRLRLGYVEYASRRWIAPVVSAVLRRHPGARVEPHVLPAFEMADALRDGQIDLGIGIRPISGPGITTRTLAPGAWKAVLTEAHPLARRGAITVGMLRDRPLILFDRSLNSSAFDHLIDRFRRAGFVPNVAFQTVEPGLGVELAARDVGVLLIASYALPPVPPGVVVRSVKGIRGRPTLGLAWRRSDTSRLTATAIRAAAAEPWIEP